MCLIVIEVLKKISKNPRLAAHGAGARACPSRVSAARRSCSARRRTPHAVAYTHRTPRGCDLENGFARDCQSAVMLFRRIILMLLAADAVASQASWPMFRGRQDLAGTAAGSLPDSLELRWRFKTGGPVKSSAAIEGDRVVIGSDDNHVYCLDSHGEKMWAFKTGDAVEASPLILGDHVYIGSADAQLYKLDLATGNSIGRIPPATKSSAEKLDPDAGREHRTNSRGQLRLETALRRCWSPAKRPGPSRPTSMSMARRLWLTEKSFSAAAMGSLHVVSAADGKELAKIEAGAYMAGSVALKEGFAYLGHYGNEVVCVDLETETVAWRYKETRLSLFFFAGGDGRACHHRWARQASPLSRTRDGHTALGISNGRQGGQLAGHLRRQDRIWLRGWTALYSEHGGGKGTMVLRDRQAAHRFACHSERDDHRRL